MKKKLIVLLLCTGLIVWFYITKQEKNKEDSPLLTIYGNVDIRDVALGFRVTGRVDNMLVDEGDNVKEGELLATLDSKPFMDELTVRASEFAMAQAVLINAEKEYKRVAKLVISGAVSRSDYDEALSKRDAALAEKDMTKAYVALATTQLDDAKLLAPSNGVILTRIREKGAITIQGTPIYTLALLDPVWIRTYIDEPQLGHIFPGQEALIKTDSGDVYKGQVGFISPQAEFTPKTVETTTLRTDLVYRLRVVVQDPNNGLRQGMPVTIEIVKRIPTNATE